MDKTVKILYLTTNQILVTELVEVAAIDIGAPDCKMVNPFILKDDKSLEPWLLNVTKDDIFMIRSDKSLTRVDPTHTLIEKDLDLTK